MSRDSEKVLKELQKFLDAQDVYKRQAYFALNFFREDSVNLVF